MKAHELNPNHEGLEQRVGILQALNLLKLAQKLLGLGSSGVVVLILAYAEGVRDNLEPLNHGHQADNLAHNNKEVGYGAREVVLG